MAELNNSGTGQWSETDASNTSAAPDGWVSGTMTPVQVEPTGRAMMGAIKRFWDRINGTVTTTGSAGTYVYTPTNTSFPTAYVDGEEYSFAPNFTSVGGDTLNINGLGAKALYKKGASGYVAVEAGDIQTGGKIKVQYSSSLGGFVVIGLTSALFGTTWAPTPAVGDYSNKVCTTAFASQLAMNAALPNQAGNTGKWVQTNGAVASWETLPITYGATTTTSATSLTLTAASPGLQRITMTAAGQNVTLPDARTMATGGPVFMIRNDGTNQFAVRDSNGVGLAFLPARVTVLVFLSDNTTSAGQWAIGNVSEYTSLQSCLLWGQTVLNTVSDTAYGMQIASLGSSKYLALFNSTSSVATACVITFTGSGFSVGSLATITGLSGNLSIALLSSTAALVTGNNSSGYPTSVVLTISGSTITIGALTTINAVAASAQGQCCCALSATAAVVGYYAAANQFYTVPVTISGTTITVGTAASISASAYNGALTTSLVPLTATSYVALWQDTTDHAQASYCTVASNTSTVQSTFAVDTSLSAQMSVSSAPLTATTALICWGQSSGNQKLGILSLSGSTLSMPGGAVSASIKSGSIGGSGPTVVCLDGTNCVLFTSGNNSSAQVQTFTISGTTVSTTGGKTSSLTAASAAGEYSFTGQGVSGSILQYVALTQDSNGYPNAVVAEFVK